MAGLPDVCRGEVEVRCWVASPGVGTHYEAQAGVEPALPRLQLGRLPLSTVPERRCIMLRSWIIYAVYAVVFIALGLLFDIEPAHLAAWGALANSIFHRYDDHR